MAEETVGFDYRPLSGPSVWIKLPNRDPKKLGALQRFDRANLEKLKARIQLAEKKLAAAEREQKEEAEARNRFKPGTRVYYNLHTYGFARPTGRKYGTVLHENQARKLLGVSFKPLNDRYVYALMDGSLSVETLYANSNLFVADEPEAVKVQTRY